MNEEEKAGRKQETKKKPYCKPTAELIRFESAEEMRAYLDCRLRPQCAGEDRSRKEANQQ